MEKKQPKEQLETQLLEVCQKRENSSLVMTRPGSLYEGHKATGKYQLREKKTREMGIGCCWRRNCGGQGAQQHPLDKEKRGQSHSAERVTHPNTSPASANTRNSGWGRCPVPDTQPGGQTVPPVTQNERLGDPRDPPSAESTL